MDITKTNPLKDECKTKDNNYVKQVGGIENIMDKSIGRAVYKIVGSVSANNFVEFSNLNLAGTFVYFQLKLLNKIATIHMEITTTNNTSIRFSISSLYATETPRFFERSIRLPLPRHTSWMIVKVDINAILKKYCSNGSVQHELQSIKKIQLCSNMLIRDVVTTSEPFNTFEPIPKILNIKSRSDVSMTWVDIENSSSTQQVIFTNTSSSFSSQSSQLSTVDNSLATACSENCSSKTISTPAVKSIAITMQDLATSTTRSVKSPHSLKLFRSSEKLKSPITSASKSSSKGLRKSQLQSKLSINNSDLMHLDYVVNNAGGRILYIYGGDLIVATSNDSILLLDISESEANSKLVTGLWKYFSLPRESSNNEVSSNHGYRQRLLKCHDQEINLLQVSHNEAYMVSCEHAQSKENLSILLMWDLGSGNKLFILEIQLNIISVAFSYDCSMLATVGFDNQQKVHIHVWDMTTLLREVFQKSSDQSANSPVTLSGDHSGRLFAKQLSDFPISTIVFSPFDAASLISCGKENVRFWRIRKKHLPGRPILLGTYSRGYHYDNIAFYNAPQSTLIGRHPCLYISSNRGIILQVDTVKESIIATYQIYSSAIISFVISNGFAVTTSQDKKLHIWPLDFEDYCLEVQHEGCVNFIRSNTVAPAQLLLCTSTGTVGTLNILHYQYKTLFRAHTSSINRVAYRYSTQEFATISADSTIRIWDVLSYQQRYEFTSLCDEPVAVAYHPHENILACGFKSGFVRVFDISTTTTLLEKKYHHTPIYWMKYFTLINKVESISHQESEMLLFASLCFEGILVIYDVTQGYIPVFSLSVSAVNDVVQEEMTLNCALSENNRYLVVSRGTLASLVIIDIVTKQIVYKWGLLPVSMQSVNRDSTTSEHDDVIGKNSQSIPDISQLPGFNLTRLQSSIQHNILLEMNLFINHLVSHYNIDGAARIFGLELLSDISVLGNYVIILLEKHVVLLPIDLSGEFPCQVASTGSYDRLICKLDSKFRPKRLYYNQNLKRNLLFVSLIDNKTSGQKSKLAVYGYNLSRDFFGIAICLQGLFHEMPGEINDLQVAFNHNRIVCGDAYGAITTFVLSNSTIASITHSTSTEDTNDLILDVDSDMKRLTIQSNDVPVENPVLSMEMAVCDEWQQGSHVSIESNQLYDNDTTRSFKRTNSGKSLTIDTSICDDDLDYDYTEVVKDEELNAEITNSKKIESTDDVEIQDMDSFYEDDSISEVNVLYEPVKTGVHSTALGIMFDNDDEDDKNLDILEDRLDVSKLSDPIVSDFHPLHLVDPDTNEIKLLVTPVRSQLFIDSFDNPSNQQQITESLSPISATNKFEYQDTQLLQKESITVFDPVYCKVSNSAYFHCNSTIYAFCLYSNVKFRIAIPEDFTSILGKVEKLSISPCGTLLSVIYCNASTNNALRFLVLFQRDSIHSISEWKYKNGVQLSAPDICYGVTMDWILSKDFKTCSHLSIISFLTSNIVCSIVSSSCLCSGELAEMIVNKSFIVSPPQYGCCRDNIGHIWIGTHPNNEFDLLIWQTNKFYCLKVNECDDIGYTFRWFEDWGINTKIVGVSSVIRHPHSSSVLICVIDSLGGLKCIMVNEHLKIRTYSIKVPTLTIPTIPIQFSVYSVPNSKQIYDAKSICLNYHMVVTYPHEVRVINLVVQQDYNPVLYGNKSSYRIHSHALCRFKCSNVELTAVIAVKNQTFQNLKTTTSIVCTEYLPRVNCSKSLCLVAFCKNGSIGLISTSQPTLITNPSHSNKKTIPIGCFMFPI